MVSRPLTLHFFLLFYAQRRETWCPGALLANAPLVSSAALAANSVQVRLARIPSSPSSEESEFDEMSRDAFLSTLDEEEERKSLEDGRRKVAFASPRAKRFVPSVLGQVTLPVSWGERVLVTGELKQSRFGDADATGSELFSLLTCPHTTTFTLLLALISIRDE